jgi:Ca2+-binding EF-hand superfamily protein
MPGKDAMTIKLTNVFTAFDADRDGYLEASDFQSVVTDLSTEFGLKAGDLKYRALRNAYEVLWDELQRHADTDGDRQISLPEFIENGYRAIADTSRVNVVDHLGNAVFEVVDTNKDEQVSREEFARLQRAFRVTAANASETFEAIDTDNDGHISRPEFLQGVRDYFTSPNFNGPGSWFFGRPD